MAVNRKRVRYMLAGCLSRYGVTACVSALLHASFFVIPKGHAPDEGQKLGDGGTDSYSQAPMVMLSMDTATSAGDQDDRAKPDTETAVFQETERTYDLVPERWTPDSIDYSYLTVSIDPGANAFVVEVPAGFGSASGAVFSGELQPKGSGRRGGGRASGMGGVPVFMPQPPYPVKALKEHREGNVALSLVVERDGRVVSVDIETSSGSTDLDESAKETICHQWRFAKAQAPWRTRVLVHFDVKIADAR